MINSKVEVEVTVSELLEKSRKKVGFHGSISLSVLITTTTITKVINIVYQIRRDVFQKYTSDLFMNMNFATGN